MALWQVAAGDAERNYDNCFLDHDVALIGPGDPGQWTQAMDDSRFGGSYVRRFAHDLRHNDTIVLRKGRNEVVAVGIVEGEYSWENCFGDVNGWDLQHCRRVRWQRLEQGDRHLGEDSFGRSPSRFSRVAKQSVVEKFQDLRLQYENPLKAREVKQLPEAAPDLLIEALEDEQVRRVVEDIERKLHLLRDRDNFGPDHPSESEMVAHFVVPLLKALGWPSELIALQWKNIDVALFAELPRAQANLKFVVEAKRLDRGVEHALGQAQGYIRAHGGNARAVVTDGIRWRLYDGDQPSESLNLARLKQTALGFLERMRFPA